MTHTDSSTTDTAATNTRKARSARPRPGPRCTRCTRSCVAAWRMAASSGRIDRMPLDVVFACEHASKRVPLRYQKLFRGRAALLDTHRGWDPGALELAQRLQRALHVPLLAGRVSRRHLAHPPSSTATASCPR